MATSGRSADRRALLARADADLAKVEAQYNASLHAKAIGAELRIDVKNLMENLRSILEYVAEDIRDTHCPTAKTPKPVYFPILPDRPQFEARMQQWYPNLNSTKKTLWDYLEFVQPYHPGFKWLGQFNRVNNENKHSSLVEQTRVEVDQVRATMPGGGSVSWNPASVRFGSEVLIGGVPVDPRTQMPVPHPSLKVERITWVDFQFDGVGVSALGLLKAAASGIKGIVTEVERHL